MRILGFGTYDVAQHPRVGVLFDGLRSHADEVEEINEPLQMSTADRVHSTALGWPTGWRSGSSPDGPPWSAGPGASIAPSLSMRSSWGTWASSMLSWLASCSGERQWYWIFWSSDRTRPPIARARSRLVVKLLDLLDRAAVSSADLVLVDTEEQVQSVAPRQRHKALPVPVGAADLWFRARPAVAADDGRSPLRVVFFGLFTPLQGTPVIGEAVARLSDQPGIEIHHGWSRPGLRRCPRRSRRQSRRSVA